MHVTFCLARGLSNRFRWILRGKEFPRVLTIGASASCDWQIQAPGVAAHALSVAFNDGTLYVASGPDAFVTSDGVLLRETWQELTHSTRLQLGAAELEVDYQGESPEEEEDSERESPPCDPEVERTGARRGVRTTTQPRSSHIPFLDMAALLGSEAGPPRQRRQLLRAMSFVLLTAIAYGAWLSLLDQF